MIKNNINKFYAIFNEFQKNISDEFSTEDLINATKDLIKYSKNDFIHKSFVKDYDNDNRKPLDRVFNDDKNFIPTKESFLTFEDLENEEFESFKKFNSINKGGF